MSILDKIVATKRQELAALPAAAVVDSLQAEVARSGRISRRPGESARSDIGLIAGSKASPSAGIIQPDLILSKSRRNTKRLAQAVLLTDDNIGDHRVSAADS